METTNKTTVTVTTTEPGRHARAVFAWSNDCGDCDVASFGFSDEELDALIAAKAHEGADAENVTVDIT